MPIKASKPKCTVYRESLSHLLLPVGHDKTTSSGSLEPRFRFLIPGSNKVRVVRGLLSGFESTSLIQAIESLGFSTPTAFDKSVRACERRHTVDLGMSDVIMSRLKSYLPEIVHIDGVRWRLKRLSKGSKIQCGTS